MGRFKDIWCGRKLLSAIKSFYEKASACDKISGETSESFEIKVGLRQGCVMSPWLFNIYMDGVIRERKEKAREGDSEGKEQGPGRKVNDERGKNSGKGREKRQ